MAVLTISQWLTPADGSATQGPKSIHLMHAHTKLGGNRAAATGADNDPDSQEGGRSTPSVMDAVSTRDPITTAAGNGNHRYGGSPERTQAAGLRYLSMTPGTAAWPRAAPKPLLND